MRRAVLLPFLLLALLSAGLVTACGGATPQAVEQSTAAQTVSASPTPSAVDTRAPSSLTSGASEDWQAGPVEISLSVTDNSCSAKECTVFYSVDGGEWRKGTSLTVRGNGRHEVRHYAVDDAGNKEEKARVVIRIDGRPPVTQALNSPSVRKGKTVTLKYRIDDQTSRVVASLRLTGPKNETIDLGSQPTGTQRGKQLKANLPAGTYAWCIYARDQAGNKATQRASGQLVVEPKPQTNTGGGASGGYMVGIAESGECYHELTCYHWTKDPAGNSKVTVEQAKAMGYRPCKVCNPPQ